MEREQWKEKSLLKPQLLKLWAILMATEKEKKSIVQTHG